MPHAIACPRVPPGYEALRYPDRNYCSHQRSFLARMNSDVTGYCAFFIQLHHDPLIGKSINAASYVWDLVIN